MVPQKKRKHFIVLTKGSRVSLGGSTKEQSFVEPPSDTLLPFVFIVKNIKRFIRFCQKAINYINFSRDILGIRFTIKNIRYIYFAQLRHHKKDTDFLSS